MRDEVTVNHLSKGPFSKSPFIANRWMTQGNYARTSITYDWHPDANAEFMRPGFGAQFKYSRGDGDFQYQRLEARMNTRMNSGPWTLAARFDAGAVFGSHVPPQQLFELGRESGLPGYEYKEFVGDRAALLRGLAQYRLGVLQAPIKLTQRWWLPGLAPSLALSLQSGWTNLADLSGRIAQFRLGTRTNSRPGSSLLAEQGSGFQTYNTSMPQYPIAVASKSVRTTVAAGLRFFGGAVGVGVARPVDHAANWKFQFQFGRAF